MQPTRTITLGVFARLEFDLMLREYGESFEASLPALIADGKPTELGLEVLAAGHAVLLAQQHAEREQNPTVNLVGPGPHDFPCEPASAVVLVNADDNID